MYVPSLQNAVDRYATSLAVPTMLEKLHPRKQGNPGNAGALAPAVVLTTISAFEGFVEEFLALLAAHRGQGFGQIAKLVSINNPTVKTFDAKLKTVLSWDSGATLKSSFAVDIWKPPTLNDSTWIGRQTITWEEAEKDAESWMQVRHCLTHGLARGFRPEKWPGALKGGEQAVDVLRPRDNGRHSLSIHGAESCGRIFRSTAEFLSNAAASYIGHDDLNWSKVPEFTI